MQGKSCACKNKPESFSYDDFGHIILHLCTQTDHRVLFVLLVSEIKTCFLKNIYSISKDTFITPLYYSGLMRMWCTCWVGRCRVSLPTTSLACTLHRFQSYLRFQSLRCRVNATFPNMRRERNW